jgi:hypothetical protein
MNIGDLIKNAVVPLISVVTALMVAWLNYSVSERDQRIQGELSKITAQVTLNKEEREERESNQQFNLKIYEIVTESLEERNAKKQEAAQAFVVVMVEEPLRSSLLNVLKQGGAPEVQEKVGQILEAENRFKDAISLQAQVAVSSDAQVTVPPSYQWGDWDFDIFWCAGSGDAAKQQADLIGKQLLAEGSKGRIRIRELPDSINAKAGYQISGYAIRRNSDRRETETAGALKNLAETVLDKNGVTATFSVGVSYQNTPWYISAFVCPGQASLF